eukprot:1964627-Pyramimonas_sp.AAC.1
MLDRFAAAFGRVCLGAFLGSSWVVLDLPEALVHARVVVSGRRTKKIELAQWYGTVLQARLPPRGFRTPCTPPYRLGV